MDDATTIRAAQVEETSVSVDKTNDAIASQHQQQQRNIRISRHASGPLLTRAFALIVSAMLLTACATRPPATAFERPVTHALPATDATPLAAALAAPERAHPGQSGFRVLSDGTEALQMRIALARAATKTLDMQYYIAEEDTTGKLLLAA